MQLCLAGYKLSAKQPFCCGGSFSMLFFGLQKCSPDLSRVLSSFVFDLGDGR